MSHVMHTREKLAYVGWFSVLIVATGFWAATETRTNRSIGSGIASEQDAIRARQVEIIHLIHELSDRRPSTQPSPSP